jgi:hypothetical protein
LSQTFYLVCTDLGLAPFFTATINDANIDDRLGLDGVEESALALCGCGFPAAERAPLERVFDQFTPRR